VEAAKAVDEANKRVETALQAQRLAQEDATKARELARKVEASNKNWSTKVRLTTPSMLGI
jgi:hypothetical protein